MCGIIGYCGDNVAPVIFQGLKRMEYRGYDSAGIAVIDKGMLWVRKDVGKLDDVDAKLNISKMEGYIGIGHTRWATHGGVTRENAHPHVDCTLGIAVVHNGIIDNYKELKENLMADGHVFQSETDTETICHIIESKSDYDLEEAVRIVGRTIKGSNSFIAVSVNNPDRIVGYCNGSPLIVGVNEVGTFFVSDITALPSGCEYVVMSEDTVAVITRSDVKFYNSDHLLIYPKFQRADCNVSPSQKNGYDHYMLKEIMEQPQTLLDSINQDKDNFTSIALDILRARHVVITACGSSRYAALVGRYMFSSVGRTFCEVVMGSEFQYFANSIDKGTLVIAVSQSGETRDVIDGVKLAREAGAKIVSIINRPQSLLERLSDNHIYLNCGVEIGVAATKSFLNQLCIFYLLASSMTHSFGMAVKEILALSHNVNDVIHNNVDYLKKLADELYQKDDVYFIARGINFAIASEASLKLKEISYVHAEGMPAGELKHGTLSLIEKGTPVVVICPNDYTYTDTISNAIEAKARGALIIGVSDKKHDVFDYYISLPTVSELLYPFLTIVPLQLFAYYVAYRRGCNPDMPRNLAKSVTVK